MNILYFSWKMKSRDFKFNTCRGVLEHDYYDEYDDKFKTFKGKAWISKEGKPCISFWDIDSDHPRTAVNYSVGKA